MYLTSFIDEHQTMWTFNAQTSTSDSLKVMHTDLRIMVSFVCTLLCSFNVFNLSFFRQQQPDQVGSEIVLL